VDRFLVLLKILVRTVFLPDANGENASSSTISLFRSPSSSCETKDSESSMSSFASVSVVLTVVATEMGTGLSHSVATDLVATEMGTEFSHSVATDLVATEMGTGFSHSVATDLDSLLGLSVE
jgi:hypothetical protein